MKLKPEEYRIDGYSSGFVTSYYKATHLPTGAVVEIPFADGAGAAGRRKLIEALECEVERIRKLSE